ncbi:proline-rich extensin-like protein EPR1 [Venturia canescens]|uniref:proline-rich extensin-like protein EPR1 n=1 Tax=Venturia canescens TaxID=32260 RepID=UPI001C9D3278|nr:proline-rich extensin-like protein EPR1 [Venturia canescens]
MGEGAEEMSTGLSDVEAKALPEMLGIKSKRYLSHQHGSPCPPFYPHFGMHTRMHDTRPYGPPAYPKNEIHPVMHHAPKELQYVHQPSYTSYVPKQTIQYVKPEYKAPVYQSPIYHAPVIAPIDVKPAHPVIKQEQPSYYHHYQQPIFQAKTYPKPVFSYAPAYHKPMPMIWPATPVKKYEYPAPQIPYHEPSIVYKPEPPKCAPCPPAHVPPPQHHPPSLSYLKVIQPAVVHHVEPAKTYLPAPVHPSVVKPCDK